MKRSREQLDVIVYLRGFAVLARNPTVIVLPLLAGVCGMLVNQMTALEGDGGLLASITTFILLLLQLFALGVSIIIADQGWRRGTASFDDAWQDARRKGGEIVMAAFGMTFILSIARYAGSILQSGLLGTILLAIAGYGLVYCIAAAAIGGVPGGAAISVSIDRVRSAPLASALLAVVTLVLLFYVGLFLVPGLIAGLGITSPLLIELVDVVVQSVLYGYVAIMMAKVYNDVSFTSPRW